MPVEIAADSVGIIEPKKQRISEPLTLSCGRTLADYDLVYETYGELNKNNSNAVLICHALSGNHHAAGYHAGDEQDKPGWWDAVSYTHLTLPTIYSV